MLSFRIKLFCMWLWIGSSAIMASAPCAGFAHFQLLPASRLEHCTRRTCQLRSSSTQLAAVKREDPDRTRKMLSNPEVVRVMQDPKIMQAMMEIQMGGPEAIEKYADDADVLWFLSQIQQQQQPADAALFGPQGSCDTEQLFTCMHLCGFTATYDEVATHETTCEWRGGTLLKKEG